VSGLGATPVNELYVLYDQIDKRIAERGLKIHKSYVGNYFTSLEMVGATLTIMALNDDTKTMLDTPCDCPAMNGA
jgi:dihydroxyacetone kinase-like protein